MTDQVWAYDQGIDDFRLFQTAQEWKDHITMSGAISYLKKHLQKSLKDDFYPAYEAYIRESYERKIGVGFFALARIIFPYITFLGTLLGGGDSSENAIKYMNKYLSKVNSTFGDKQLCDFIYRVYRHGLAHTNMPKVASENGKIFGWQISLDDTKHLRVFEGSGLGKAAILSISPKKLADEAVSSIDEYIRDLQTETALFDKFKNGFLCMATVKRLKISRYLKQ